MNLKKFGTALVVVLALGAVMASTTFAAATTQDTQWTWNGAVISGSKTVTASGSMSLATEIGGVKLDIASTGLECLSTAPCTIKNEAGSATLEGKVKFTGVTVEEPAGCQVSGGSITTNLLTIDPDYMIGTANYALIKPFSGTTFATITIEKKTGQTCPVSGSYLLKGTVFVKAQNATGVTAHVQKVNSSRAINEEAGGSLAFIGGPATLTGEVAFTAEGASTNLFGTESR
jgi:hypothetical protein